MPTPPTITAAFTYDGTNITANDSTIINAKASTKQVIDFTLTNTSSDTITDWGLYFNNPFSSHEEAESQYKFGGVGSSGGIGGGTLNIEKPGTILIPRYSSYLVYVLVGKTYTILDPQIVLSGGDVND